MDNPHSEIKAHFEAHLALVQRASQGLTGPISRAFHLLSACLFSGSKVLVCGNGGSAADAQHFATELVVRYRHQRSPMAALALTTDSSILTAAANDDGFATVFQRQVEALGRPGDLLLAISTSGDSENIFRACSSAMNLGLGLIALTGESGGRLAGLLGPDLNAENVMLLKVPGQKADEVQQIHLLVLHVLCELLEEKARRR